MSLNDLLRNKSTYRIHHTQILQPLILLGLFLSHIMTLILFKMSSSQTPNVYFCRKFWRIRLCSCNTGCSRILRHKCSIVNKLLLLQELNSLGKYFAYTLFMRHRMQYHYKVTMFCSWKVKGNNFLLSCPFAL